MVRTPSTTNDLAKSNSIAESNSIAGSGIVMVCVGTERKWYYWHIGLICQESTYIASCLNTRQAHLKTTIPDPTAEDASNLLSLEFPSESPEHFHLISEWLYAHDLSSVSKPAAMTPIFDLYRTACRLGMEALENYLIDMMHKHTDDWLKTKPLATMLSTLKVKHISAPGSRMVDLLQEAAAIRIAQAPKEFTAMENNQSALFRELFAAGDLMRRLMLKAWDEETATLDMSWESGRRFHSLPQIQRTFFI